MQLEDVHVALGAAGLDPRGAFHPEPHDAVPRMPTGAPVKTLVLAGNAGPRMWAAFSPLCDNAPEPLDAWSDDVLTRVAQRLGAAAFFPFRRPYLPFQRWARRAEPCHVSPLGILIHPDYGLWHGYRGALGFSQRLDLPPPDARASPCATCADKPCLGACPVGAFEGARYDVAKCIGYLKTSAGRDCLDFGCQARRACPVGRVFVYEPAQAQFHMNAFLRRHRGDSPAQKTPTDLDGSPR